MSAGRLLPDNPEAVKHALIKQFVGAVDTEDHRPLIVCVRVISLRHQDLVYVRLRRRLRTYTDFD